MACWRPRQELKQDDLYTILKTPPNLFPVHGTLAGYVLVLHQQLPYLGTSLAVGLGTVALTLVVAAPAGYSLAKLRPRGGGMLRFTLVIAQMIPAIIMASNGKRGYTSTKPYNHYSLLATIDWNWSLGYIGAASDHTQVQPLREFLTK